MSDPLRPVAPYDDELLRHVAPPEWRSPQPAGRYHLVAVGAGTAGLVAAGGATGLGARTALVERRLMGGDCLNFGCVPSKGLIAAARSWDAAARSHAEFAGPAVTGAGDFASAMQRMRRLRAEIAPHDGAARFRDLGVDVFLGEATFTGPDRLRVGDSELRFRRAVIATGGRAAAPPIPGLDSVDYLTNETLFSLTSLPARLAVIGGGPIGCEMAQAFARFGAKVTLLEMEPRLLPREDPDAAEVVAGALRGDGVDVRTAVGVRRVEKRAGCTVVVVGDGEAEREVEVDSLLVAVGRRPNVEGLGLEAAGVEHDRDGIVVDDFLRTSNRRIYAAGDVASRFKFTHVADAQARIVVQNALFFGRARASRLVVSWCTYTSPEVAHVGMYEHEALAAGHAVETVTLPMREVDRARIEGETEGFLRVHHERGKPLGATLVAERAGDMIGELALAITTGTRLGALSATIHPYPTQGEIARKVGDAYRRAGLTPTVRRLLAAWFRVFA